MLFQIRNIYLFSFLPFSLLLSGCSGMEFSLDSESLASIFSENGIIINDNAPFTKESDVTLRVFGLIDQEMYITNDPTCENGGTWTSFSSTQSWVLSKENDRNRVYVKFRSDEQVSDCLSDDIVHDNIPPEVDFKRHPEKETNQESDEFVLGAADELSGIAEYFCGDKINNQECSERVELDNLSEGLNKFSYFVVDRAGNQSKVLTYEWFIDSIPPRIFWHRTPPLLTRNTYAHFEFSAEGSHAQQLIFECSVDASEPSPCENVYNVSALSHGKHIFQVKAQDRLGNIALLNYEWVVDNIQPSVKIIEAPDRYTNQIVSKFKFLSMDRNPIQSFECRIDNGYFQPCLPEESFLLSEGEHIISIRTRDAVGNISPIIVHKWGIDLTLPVAQITMKPPKNTDSGDARFAITATDSWTGVVKIYCGVDGVIATCANSVDYKNLSEGVHIFEMYAEDKAGNRSHLQRYNWEIAFVRPSVEVTSGPTKWSNSSEVVLEFEGTKGSKDIQSYQCSVDGGVYQTCMSPHRVTQLAEGSHVFRVVAYDTAHLTSKEASYSWNTDTTGPILQWSEVPGPHEMWEDSFANFSVSDVLSGVQEAHCQVNSENLNCEAGQRLKLVPLAFGINELVVNVFDRAGNMSSLSYQWNVDDPHQVVTQSVTIHEPAGQIDILFVVGSSKFLTRSHRSLLAERLKNFISLLDDLDWHIAVTSTDPNEGFVGSDGKFVPFPNGHDYIDGTLGVDMATEYLGQTVNIEVPFYVSLLNPDGVRMAYRAIERATETSSYHEKTHGSYKSFFRDQASLEVILISDGVGIRPGLLDGGVPRDVVGLVKDIWGDDKNFVFHSLIPQDRDPDCQLSEKEAQRRGKDVYPELSRATGGAIGSLCAADYAEELTGHLGANIIRSEKPISSVSLECPPVDRNKDGNQKNDIIFQSSDGSLVTDFTLDDRENVLRFSENLPMGSYHIEYFCSQQTIL